MKKLVRPLMLVASLALASATNANAITNNVETAAVEISQQVSIQTERQIAAQVAWYYYNTGQILRSGWNVGGWYFGCTVLCSNILVVYSPSGTAYSFKVSSF